MGSTPKMSQAEFKVLATRLITSFGQEAFDDMPLWVQITALAASKTDNEDGFAVELRKSFCLFGEAEQSSKLPSKTRAS